jgi:hypothetical protein
MPPHGAGLDPVYQSLSTGGNLKLDRRNFVKNIFMATVGALIPSSLLKKSTKKQISDFTGFSTDRNLDVISCYRSLGGVAPGTAKTFLWRPCPTNGVNCAEKHTQVI